MNMGKTILIVEDETLIRRAASLFLESKGFQVLEAENGAEGLEVFQKKQIDAVITDLRMPVMDGMALVKELVEIAPDTPVVIFSGMGKMVDVIETIRAGAWDYLTKPLQSMEVLELCLTRVLERAAFIKNENERRLFLEQEVKARSQKLQEQNQRLKEEIQERKKQESKVLQAKIEWERTVDAMSDMLAIIDLDHNILRINEPLKKQLGSAYKEIYNQKCYACLHGCGNPIEDCIQKEVVRDEKEHYLEIYEENLGGYCKLTASPYYDQTGKLIGSVHIIRNINDQFRAEWQVEKFFPQMTGSQQLEPTEQLAKRLNEENAPSVQLLKDNMAFLKEAFQQTTSNKAVYDAKTGSLINTMDRNALDLKIQQVIRESAAETVKVEEFVKAVNQYIDTKGKTNNIADINELLNASIKIARNEWKDTATIETIFADASSPALCNADQIRLVFVNVIVNAAQGISEKIGDRQQQGKGRIRIETRHSSGWVVITISDTGNGIPEENYSQVFEPFFTTKSAVGGGQGLSVSYDIITHKHGGEMFFTSKEGKGTVFTIKLPIEPERV